MNRPDETGFSVVEILITLFIAFLFIMMGYQLYTVAMKESGDGRLQARAHNIAYKYLRKEVALQKDSCPTPPPATTQDVSSEIPGGSLITTVDCPFPLADSLPLPRVTIRLQYGDANPKQEVLHAMYAG